MNSKLKKNAASAIRQLAEENAKLQEELNHVKLVTSLLFKLYQKGGVSAENLDSYYSDLLEKSTNDLNVLEKVSEFNLSTDLSLGSLSDRIQDDGTLDSFTRFLLED